MSSITFLGQFGKFWVISIIGGVLQVLINVFLTEFIFSREFWWISLALAIGIVTLWNFALNKLWTFKGEAEEKGVKLQGAQYALVGLSGVFVNYGVTGFLVLFILGVNLYALANTIGIATSICSNFLLNKYWTFKS
ncbi:MAG: GtrA family protein [Promethearchaeota archaeon]